MRSQYFFALGYWEVVSKPLNILADVNVPVCLGLLPLDSLMRCMMGPLGHAVSVLTSEGAGL